MPLFLKPGTYTVAGDVRSPPPLLLSLLVCWCDAGVLLVWCACGGFDGGGAAAVAFVCEDEALSRTKQARYAVVGV